MILKHPIQVAVRLAVVGAALAVVTVLCRRLAGVNEVTAGFAYVITVLVVAGYWGLIESLAASIAAVLLYNYFFLPPVGTFTISDPKNWVALFAFLLTSLVASKLSDRAAQRAAEALARQRDMERLYALGRAILLSESGEKTLGHLAVQIARVFNLPAVCLFESATARIAAAGSETLGGIEQTLRETAVQGSYSYDRATRTTVTAVRLGGSPIGSLALRGAEFPDTVLQAIVNLVAIELERASIQQSMNRAEAARQSEELKSTLLDAIAHEFQTPLTSIKAATSALLEMSGHDLGDARELVAVVDEEAGRLSRLVHEAIRTAHLEARTLRLEKQLLPVRSLIDRAVAGSRALADDRPVFVEEDSALPAVLVDPDLAGIALRQVLENALRYSPPGSPVRVTARQQDGRVLISVADRGPGIPADLRERIFEKFYRIPSDRRSVAGTGMGLSIARHILRAHGGDILVDSQPGQGSIFTLAFAPEGRSQP